MPSQPADPPSLAAGAEQKSDPPPSSQDNPEGGSALCRILALMEAAIAVPSHGLYGPGERPWARNLLFPGFGTGLLNFSLAPVMMTCLGNKDSLLCAPVSPGGHSGCWGDTRCLSWQGGGNKPGICMIPKCRGQPWGLPEGMQVTRDRSDGDGASCSGTSSDLMPKDLPALPVRLISFPDCTRHPSAWKLSAARTVRLSCLFLPGAALI